MKEERTAEMNIEQILSASRFTDEQFKNSLREKLFQNRGENGKAGFSDDQELSLDDLEMAAGGKKTEPEISGKLWNDPGWKE